MESEFKDIITNKNIDDESFVDLINKNYKYLNYDFPTIGNPMVFALMVSEKWKIAEMFYVYFNHYTVQEKIILEMIRYDRQDIIEIFNPSFWVDYFYDTMSLCVKTSNTSFAKSVLRFLKDKNVKLLITIDEKTLLNKLLFLSSLRNEFEAISVFIYYGALPNVNFEGINVLTILYRNNFDTSYLYVREKYPNVILSEIVEFTLDDIDFIVQEYVTTKDIYHLSFNIAKFGGGILNFKDKKGRTIIELVIRNGTFNLFVRLFEIMNDRSEKTLKELIDIAKVNGKTKIVEKLIEESIK